MENEFWKDIPGYEGFYQASNLGRIRSVDRYVTYKKTKHLMSVKGKILRPSYNGKGYLQLTLCRFGKQITYKVHYLVWISFNGLIPEGMQINHINEIKSDNRLINLNLMTPKENANWGTRNERVSIGNINKNRSKEVIQFDLQGNYIKHYPSINELKRQYGYSSALISRCCMGKNKTAYGYVWKYNE